MAAPDFIPLDNITAAPDFIPLTAVNGQATPDYGIDFTQPKAQVRAAIQQLPVEQREPATKAWAKASIGKVRADNPLPEIPIGKLPFENEINAGLGAGLDWLSGGKLGRPYNEGLTFAREARSQEKEAHPTSTLVGDIASGFALPMPAPAATALGRVGQGIKVGAGYGALQRAADGEPGFEGRLEGALKGGLIGGAAGGALGAVGEVINSRLQKAELAKYFDKATGTLTPAGEAAAKQLGIADPSQLGRDGIEKFARSYALDPKAAQAAIDSGTVEFGIPATRGQLTKDPERLMQEKALRSGVMGQAAKDVINELDARQASKLEDIARSAIPNKIAPEAVGAGGPIASDLSKTDLGAAISGGLRGAKDAAKAAERAAWDDVRQLGKIHATPQAMDELLPTVQSAVAKTNIAPHPELTKASFAMSQRLEDFVAGKAEPTGLSFIGKTQGPPDIDTMRRSLYGLMKAAEPGSADKTLAGNIYGAFNDWIGQAAQKNLLAGNQQAAAKLLIARDATKTLHEAFAPMAYNQKTPGGKIVEAILKTDAGSPSQVIDRLLTQTGKMQPGTIEAVRLIDKAMQKYSPAEAAQTMGALKLAYWSKLVQKQTGDLHTPQVMLNNLKTAFADQSGLMNALFKPQEVAELKRFGEALKNITWKDPNPSGTATGLAVLAKHFISKVFESFGPVGSAVAHYSGIPAAYGYTVAKQAVRAPQIAGGNKLPALPQAAISRGAQIYLDQQAAKRR